MLVRTMMNSSLRRDDCQETNVKKCIVAFILLLLLLSVSVSISVAQEWELYTTAEDGLVQGSIRFIREDAKGYLWFITRFRGADRYDGGEFQSLKILPNNNVYFALADRAGNVWFATDQGVSRYDGKDFQNFDDDKLNSVSHILEDKDGNLWFGTDKGVIRYDENGFQTFDSAIGSAVRTILEDRDGNLWFGTDKGVIKYDGMKFSTADLSVETKAIFEDRAGNLWFGAKGGVYRKDVKSSKIEGPLLDVDVLKYDSILEDQSGNLWFATGSHGAIRYDYQSKHSEAFTAKKSGLASNNIMSMLEDSHGILWFGTNRGINRYDRQGFKHFPKVEDTTLGSVRAILEDSDENLWFGTQNGVCKYAIQNLKRFTEKDGLAEDSIKAALVDSEGNLWFGTARKGVSKYDGEVFQNFGQQDGLVDNRILSMLQDSKGNIWIGTKKGVSKYDGANFEPVTGVKAPVNTLVSVILEDKTTKDLWFVGDGVSRYDGVKFESWDSARGSEIAMDDSGNVWVGGSFDGLYRYDGESWKQYTTEDGIGSDQINWILGTDGGDVWFGLDDGIARYDGVNFRNFTVDDGLSVKVAIEDNSGRLWLGTDRGVVKCDDPGQETPHFSDPITAKDGLISNNVRSILSDGDGNLWFGTNKGVSKYDGENFQNIRLDLVRGYIHIILEDEDNDGAMWFVTEHEGVLRYIPPAKKIQPRIHITRVQAGKTYTNVDSIKAPSTVENIMFEYKGISFRSGAGRIRYTYHLEGHDDEWSIATSDTRAYYESLKPGHYQFRVRAIDVDLHKSDPPATVDIEIFRPFYRTWQFITAIVLGGMGFLGGGGYLIVQMGRQRRTTAQLRERLRKQEEAERIQTAKMGSLQQLVAGITHEMNNPIGVISSNNDVFSRAVDKLNSMLIQGNSQKSEANSQLTRLLTVLKNVIETSRTASDRIAGIVNNPRNFVRLDEAERQRADIHEGLDNAIALLGLDVAKDYGDVQRIECSPGSLNQVFYSMLRNASEAVEKGGEIRVRTSVQDGYVKIEISDTGTGIAPEHLDRIFDPGFTTKSMGVGVGLGLSICYSVIVDEHKGRIDVSSEVGKGAAFTIWLPLL